VTGTDVAASCLVLCPGVRDYSHDLDMAPFEMCLFHSRIGVLVNEEKIDYMCTSNHHNTE
jgi:hypothetical protein